MHWLDPDHLPEILGTFERFLINPHGDADGMILSDGTEVHFPPHMSSELCAAIRKGERPQLKIRGVLPRGGELIAAVAIETVDGHRFVDDGPQKKHEERERSGAEKPMRKPMQAEAAVRRALHGPKGELRGALLEDGTIVRLPPHEAEHLSHLLLPGRPLAVRGEGLTSELGTVIEAHQAGPSAEKLRSVKLKKPKHGKPSDHRPHPLAV